MIREIRLRFKAIRALYPLPLSVKLAISGMKFRDKYRILKKVYHRELYHQALVEASSKFLNKIKFRPIVGEGIDTDAFLEKAHKKFIKDHSGPERGADE